MTDLIPPIEWTCYFKQLFEGIDFKNFACHVKNFFNFQEKFFFFFNLELVALSHIILRQIVYFPNFEIKFLITKAK